MRKVCKSCQTEKDISGFYRSSRNRDGTQNECKPCQKTTVNAWRLKNVEHLKRYYHDHLKSSPWRSTYQGARGRCRNPNHKNYHRYGARGIRLLMVPNDFKYLWFRDKAYLMERPSIDRINSDGDYTLKNCRYIEFSENLKRRKGQKKGNK